MESTLFSLLTSDFWPLCVNPDTICDDSEKDKIDRAEGITNFVIDSIGNISEKFLDFGCGEGYVANLMSNKTTISVGYDIETNETATDKCIITSDFEKIKENGPYDTVLVYDVLDHATDPMQALQQIKSVITPTSKVIIRFHPWCGRHGGHLYKQLNKAFAHIFLSDEELESLGITPKFNQKVTHPLKTYQTVWLNPSGFKLVSQKEIDKTPLESFFHNANIQSMLIPILNKLGYDEFPKFQLSQNFVDFIVQLDQST